MTKPAAVTLALGVLYIAGVGVMFIRGWGIPAAYLAMPAWYVIGVLVLLVASVVPEHLLDASLFSWAGNFVLLILSAMLNVAGVYFMTRRLSRT